MPNAQLSQVAQRLALDPELVSFAAFKGVRHRRQQLLAPAAGTSCIDELNVGCCVCAGTPDVTGVGDNLPSTSYASNTGDPASCCMHKLPFGGKVQACGSADAITKTHRA